MKGSIKLNFDTTTLSQAYLYDIKNKKHYRFYTNTDSGVVCSDVEGYQFTKAKIRKKINSWDCEAWVSNNKRAIDKVIIWICMDIAPAVQFTDLGYNFPGGVVQIEFPQNGFYYQLLDYKLIDYGEIDFKRNIECSQSTDSTYNFINNAIYGKKGLDIKD